MSSLSQQPELRNVAYEARQHLDVVVSRDADDLDARAGQGVHAGLQRPVRFEEIVVPIDDVSGEQHRRHALVHGSGHGSVPRFGGAEIACVQLLRQS